MRLAPNPNAVSTPPSPAAFGQLRAKLAKLGYSQIQIKSFIGEKIGGRNKAKIAKLLAQSLTQNEVKTIRSSRDKKRLLEKL